MKKHIFIILFIVIVSSLSAQNYRQTVKGLIIDKESHAPIEFASVMLKNTTYSKSTISNENGEFKLSDVPVGRVTLQISCMGYQSINISNLEVTMGKELVVKIEMVECIMKLDEVTIKASHNKEKPLNSFAPISTRTFSIEESQRYAGSNNDVSRMAMNFAGVKMSAETTNGIVIRGNSPVGVLFRLDGVDIPNPSHFGDGGTTGGPMSMLNNNVLSNSDFLTGAFPAEYGNTISGVFDLRIRNGNNEKHEFLGQAGIAGFEFGAEGPFSQNNDASYLINYRYSTIGIMRLLGYNPMGTAISDYQDFSFKLYLPTKQLGTFSLFGFGGTSYIKMYDSERDTTLDRQQMAYESDYELDLLNKNYSGAIGLSHSYVFGNSAYTRFILSATTISNYNKWDSLSTEDRTSMLQYYSDFRRTKYASKFYINKKFDSKNTLRLGISAEFQKFSLIDSMYDGNLVNYRTMRDYSGNDVLTQAFIQHKHKFTDNLHVLIGMNSLIQTSNTKYTLEPRAGIKWIFLPGHTISVGYGLHSYCTPIEIINQRIIQADGTYIMLNTDLNFTYSHHFIIGYDTKLFTNINFKSELYFQYIPNAVVEVDESAYSFLNHGAYTIVDVQALTNGGTGYNYGLEFTTERFMDHGMYFLSTLSLYESKYRGSDGILRNTAFNSNYVFNLLGGKEFQLKRKKDNARFIKKLVLDGKINWAGGQRYSPIDLEASRIAGTTVYNDKNAYSEQLPDYFRIDLRLGYKWIGRRSTQELAIDIRNLTNRQNPFFIKFDPETGDLKTLGFGLMPDILYRITF